MTEGVPWRQPHRHSGLATLPSGSRPLVTPYSCRLVDLLCFCVYVSLLYFCVISVLFVCLQYFDTVGWVFWPVKTVTGITYTVLVETLNHAQSSLHDSRPLFLSCVSSVTGDTRGRFTSLITDCSWPVHGIVVLEWILMQGLKSSSSIPRPI